MRSLRLSSTVFFVLAFMLQSLTVAAALIAPRITPINDRLATLTVTIEIPRLDLLYAEYLDLSIDNPDVMLASWKPSISAHSVYDTEFHDSKPVYTESFTITGTLHLQSTALDSINLLVSYYQKSNKKIAHEKFLLPLSPTGYKNSNASTDETLPAQKLSGPAENAPTSAALGWQCSLSDKLKTSSSMVVRLLIALILGILLSLTPCIYPMIPITIGILQGHGSTSLVRNFLLALSYSLGIATTFALLGLTAAYTGTLFGSILTKPIFIFSVVGLLAYLALSMIGVYEMYTPRWMINTGNFNRGGSILSVFLMGAASGTIASPCLSPGLLLLLTIVTTLKSAAMGFALLFTFGLGLSIPLLIVGTFSGSLSVLPRAGMWMVEVKRCFGFIILGASVLFLKPIISEAALLSVLSTVIFAAGLFYLLHARSYKTYGKTIMHFCSIILIATSIGIATRAYYAYQPLPATINQSWLMSSWDKARTKAIEHNKPLFVYVTAPFCSICSAIEKQLLNVTDVTHTLLATTVPVKIDGCDDVAAMKEITQKNAIVGVPTYLLLDPQTLDSIAVWGSELYKITPEEFIEELTKVSEHR